MLIPFVHRLIRKLSDPSIWGTDEENDALLVLWNEVVRLCRKKGNDYQPDPAWDSEDVAQQTFHDLYRKDDEFGVKIGQYDGNSEAQARAWLNGCILSAYRVVSGSKTKHGKAAIEARRTIVPFDVDEHGSFRLPRYGNLTAVDKKAISDRKLYQEKRNRKAHDSPEDEAA